MTDESLLTDSHFAQLEEQGFVRVDKVLTPDEVERYAQLYEAFLSGDISTGHLRGDLGGHVEGDDLAAPERITQIMWPSARVPDLHDAPLHRRSLAMARQFGGDDMAFDFDMLIDKLPHTDTPTPWHQDMSYWIKAGHTVAERLDGAGRGNRGQRVHVVRTRRPQEAAAQALGGGQGRRRPGVRGVAAPGRR